MLQTYYTYLKLLLHKRRVYIWYFIFPIFFSGLLYLVTYSIKQVEEFQKIPIAIVKELENEKVEQFIETTKHTQQADKTEMFEVRICSEEEAKDLLSEKQIDGYVLVGEGVKLFIRQNGLSQTMIKRYLDQYERYQTIQEQSVNKSFVDFIEKSKQNQETISSVIKEVGAEEENQSQMIYFYALIGMCCFQTVSFGVYLAEILLSNQSKLAKRINCSPRGIFLRFLSALAAAITIAMIGIVELITFLRFVLQCDIEIDNQFLWLILLIACMNGILLGYVIGGVPPIRRMWKEAIALTLTITFAILAGLLRTDVKYYLERKLSYLTYMNPVNLVANGMESVLQQVRPFQFVLSVLILVAYSIILLIIALIRTGRREYEHY